MHMKVPFPTVIHPNIYGYTLGTGSMLETTHIQRVYPEIMGSQKPCLISQFLKPFSRVPNPIPLQVNIDVFPRAMVEYGVQELDVSHAAGYKTCSHVPSIGLIISTLTGHTRKDGFPSIMKYTCKGVSCGLHTVI